MVGGATMICLCSPSLVGCYGLIINYIRESMDASVASTALVATMVQALNFLSTPFVAMLGYTYSFRTIAFVGGLFMSMGTILAYFANQIAVLYLTFGILGGIGFGFCAKSSLFVVNDYFDKRRGLATGAFYSGAAVGRFVFPLLIYYILQEYGFRGTLLIWGAIMANICVCACLFQPLEWHRIHAPGTVCNNKVQMTLKPKSLDSIANKDLEKSKCNEEICKTDDENVLKPFLADPITQTVVVPITKNGVEKPKQNSKKKNCSSCGCITRLFNTLDYSVLRVPGFYVVAIGYICSSFAIVNTYVFLPPLGRSHGFISDETAWLVPAVGIGEIFGRLVIPWMADLHLFQSSHAYVAGVGTCAALSIIVTFKVPYIVLLGFCFFIGVACGSTTGISTLLTAEAVGKKRLSSAIAFTQFGQGLFILPSGFILGAIRDATGDYFKCFYVIGGVYAISLAIWIVELSQRYFKSRK